MRPAASALILVAALLCGCTRPPPVKPLLALPAGLACDSAPEFGAAVLVTFEATRPTRASLAPPARCLQNAGAATPYAVFRFPPGTAPFTVTVASLAVDGNLARPVATFYDAAAQPGRTLRPTDFRPDITGLRAGVQATGREAYLVVHADTARLGDTQELILSGQTIPPTRVAAYAPVFIAPVPPPRIPDLLRSRTATVALNGTIEVSAAAQERLR